MMIFFFFCFLIFFKGFIFICQTEGKEGEIGKETDSLLSVEPDVWGSASQT